MHLRMYQVTGLLVVVAFIMFAMGLYVAEMMNNVRSHVRGENLWAKAQNGAVAELYKYAYTKNPEHIHNAQEYLVVNLGDKKARLALKANPPDIAKATEGFLEGANHPDDIPGMISLFIYYQNVYYLKKAIQIWSDADVLIGELQKITHELESAVAAGQKQRIEILITRLDVLDTRLREKEVEFSATLEEGARWIKSTLVIVNSVLFILLSVIAILVARKIARQLRSTEQQLRISDNRFMSLFRSDLVGILEFHMDGRIFEANAKFLNILGYDHSLIQEQQLNWQTLTVAEYSALDRQAIKELRLHGACEPYDKQLLHADGHKVPVYVGAVLLNGERDTGLAFVIDQTEKHRMEQELRLSAIVMDHSQDGIVILDEQQRVMSANKAFCELAKCNNQKLAGQVFNITHEEMDEEEQIAIRQALKLKENWEGDINFKTTKGDFIPVRLSISIVQDDKHEYGQYVLMLSDNKSRKAAEEQLQHLANFDTLTGIENRATFQSRLNRAIGRADRHNTECAIFFIDLNKFKPVNDHYGHEVGDGLLIQVAHRLKTLMRNIDTVARIGGDEFVVIAEEISDLRIVKDLANRIIYAVAQPYEVNGIELKISCSIGISIYPRDGENDIELIRSADIAMYAAKSKGESQYYFFNRKISL
ncbi:MAG: diguanylate cyclase [Oceanospirillaceae bacterium]|nr:diguanylate cyclase [Oceanospirillaceae bacterium]